jgi:hypothetical protein
MTIDQLSDEKLDEILNEYRSQISEMKIAENKIIEEIQRRREVLKDEIERFRKKA